MREEQIEAVAIEWVEETGWGDGVSHDRARQIILEAERRAEQRVRAEIGRDSERLDWISRTPDFFFELLQDQPGDGDIMVSTGDMVFTGSTFRSAIDAARESSND